MKEKTKIDGLGSLGQLIKREDWASRTSENSPGQGVWGRNACSQPRALSLYIYIYIYIYEFLLWGLIGFGVNNIYTIGSGSFIRVIGPSVCMNSV